MSVLLRKPIKTNVIFRGQLLKFTAAAADTVQTVLRVMSQHQLKNGAPGFKHPGGGGLNAHSLTYRRSTSRHEIFLTFHFDDTNPAIGFDFLVRMVAQRRDFDTCRLRRVQDGSIFRYIYSYAIDFDINIRHFFHSSPNLLITVLLQYLNEYPGPRPLLTSINSIKSTFGYTRSTTNTLIFLNNMRLFSFTDNGIYRAYILAQCTPLAFICLDLIG